MDVQQYLKFRQPYDRSLRQLLLEFDFFKEDLVGINIHSVHHRYKTFESASRKAATLKIPISELQDLVGIRIVVTSLDEVDVIARFFYRKADSEDLTVKSDKNIDRKKDGYRARHLVLELGGHYSRSVYPARIEVQIQTLMEHAFNYISRAWVYKSERSLSETWLNEFLEVSQQLADLDSRLNKLQKEVVASSISGGDDEPLTPFSYQHIVNEIFGEHEPIDDAVDSVRMLVDLQCDTNGKLRRFFGNPRVLRLRERFTEMLNTTGKAAAEINLNMPLHSFYMFWGTRLDAAEQFVETLASSYEKLPET